MVIASSGIVTSIFQTRLLLPLPRKQSRQTRYASEKLLHMQPFPREVPVFRAFTHLLTKLYTYLGVF